MKSRQQTHCLTSGTFAWHVDGEKCGDLYGHNHKTATESKQLFLTRVPYPNLSVGLILVVTVVAFLKFEWAISVSQKLLI